MLDVKFREETGRPSLPSRTCSVGTQYEVLVLEKRHTRYQR